MMASGFAGIALLPMPGERLRQRATLSAQEEPEISSAACENDTTSDGKPNLPWPISGYFYISVFMGPISAGPLVGALSRDWLVAVTGLVIGIAIALLDAWLFDKVFNPLVSRFQCRLAEGLPRVLVNIAAFAWAFLLTGLAMVTPVMIFGIDVLP